MVLDRSWSLDQFPTRPFKHVALPTRVIWVGDGKTGPNDRERGVYMHWAQILLKRHPMHANSLRC
jgi:hypothetical protein